MGRTSTKKWDELQMALELNKRANSQNSFVPYTEDDIKRKCYDAIFEASQAWCVTFAVNLRDAIYCEWWKVANSMLKGKRGESKDRVLCIMSLLKDLSKGR